MAFDLLSKLVPFIPYILNFPIQELDWDLSHVLAPFSVFIVGDQEEGPL